MNKIRVLRHVILGSNTDLGEVIARTLASYPGFDIVLGSPDGSLPVGIPRDAVKTEVMDILDPYTLIDTLKEGDVVYNAQVNLYNEDDPEPEILNHAGVINLVGIADYVKVKRIVFVMPEALGWIIPENSKERDKHEFIDQPNKIHQSFKKTIETLNNYIRGKNFEWPRHSVEEWVESFRDPKKFKERIEREEKERKAREEKERLEREQREKEKLEREQREKEKLEREQKEKDMLGNTNDKIEDEISNEEPSSSDNSIKQTTKTSGPPSINGPPSISNKTPELSNINSDNHISSGKPPAINSNQPQINTLDPNKEQPPSLVSNNENKPNKLPELKSTISSGSNAPPTLKTTNETKRTGLPELKSTITSGTFGPPSLSSGVSGPPSINSESSTPPGINQSAGPPSISQTDNKTSQNRSELKEKVSENKDKKNADSEFKAVEIVAARIGRLFGRYDKGLSAELCEIVRSTRWTVIGNLDAKISWITPEDAARAILIMGDSTVKRGMYNVHSFTTTTLDIVNTLSRINYSKMNITYKSLKLARYKLKICKYLSRFKLCKPKPLDKWYRFSCNQVFSMAKAQRVWEWEPFAELEQTCKETLNWYINYMV